jgi:hypothetical protein
VKQAIVLTLLTVMFLVISTPAQGQGNTVHDVFLSSTDQGANLYFVDARTGLSVIVPANGSKHTLLKNGVLFQEAGSGFAKVVFPNGNAILNSWIPPETPNTHIEWVVSENKQWILWSVTQSQGSTFSNSLFIAGIDGSNVQQLLQAAPNESTGILPLVVANTGTLAFYSRQNPESAPYQLFPAIDNIFKVDVVAGASVPLAGEPKCACGAVISDDGKLFARLEPAPDQQGFDLRLWNVDINTDTLIDAPDISHLQSGYVLISPDGTKAVYSSARGKPPGKGVPAERYVLILADFQQRTQRILTEPSPDALRAIAFTTNNRAIIAVGVGKNGTYKILLESGTVTQESNYTFLGRNS